MNGRTLMSSRQRPVLPSLPALWLSACGGGADEKKAAYDAGPAEGALPADAAFPADAAMATDGARPHDGAVHPSLEWVSISGGTFWMGSDERESDERPRHEVTLPDFELTRTEVTIEQYAACVIAGGCLAPEREPGCNWGVAGRGTHPVNCVDRDQAQAFGRWAGGRLPTEAEWEYAARSGGKDMTYPWGNEAASCDRVVMRDCRSVSTAEVCSMGAFWGLCDMAGNVWEWVEDGYHPSYEGAPADGSARIAPAGSHRVLRGGSWFSPPSAVRARSRYDEPPRDRSKVLGFRLARSLVGRSSP